MDVCRRFVSVQVCPNGNVSPDERWLDKINSVTVKMACDWHESWGGGHRRG